MLVGFMVVAKSKIAKDLFLPFFNTAISSKPSCMADVKHTINFEEPYL